GSAQDGGSARRPPVAEPPPATCPRRPASPKVTAPPPSPPVSLTHRPPAIAPGTTSFTTGGPGTGVPGYHGPSATVAASATPHTASISRTTNSRTLPLPQGASIADRRRRAPASCPAADRSVTKTHAGPGWLRDPPDQLVEPLPVEQVR